MGSEKTVENAGSSPAESVKPLGPGRCLGGGVVAGAIAFVLYKLTYSIALTFATHPIHSQNFTTQRIAAAVRTLVIGMTALGTGIFGLAAIGLMGLAIQLWMQRHNVTPAPPDET